MGLQGMDVDAAETLAGVVRLLRRAAELVWAVADAENVESPRQVLGLGIDLARDEARNLLPDAISIDGTVPVRDEPADLLRAAEQLLQRTAQPVPPRRSHGEGLLHWDESRQRWMPAVDVGFIPTGKFFLPQKAILPPAEIWS
jgi:hypothetical protein